MPASQSSHHWLHLWVHTSTHNWSGCPLLIRWTSEESPVYPFVQPQMQAGWRMDWERPWEGLQGVGWPEAQHKLATCAHSPESQSHPRLHQEKRGHQIKGRDPPPLLRSGETPPGVLPPAVEPSPQERHRPVGVRPEEGHKTDLKPGTPLQWGNTERAGAVQPGEEKTPRRPWSSLPLPEGGLHECWRGTFDNGMEWKDKGYWF